MRFAMLRGSGDAQKAHPISIRRLTIYLYSLLSVISAYAIKRGLIYMYILGYLYRFGKKIEITMHAEARAEQRGITAGMIEATINGGRVKRFGKSRIKFIKEYKRGKVVCVDEIERDRIRIVTIEWKR